MAQARLGCVSWSLIQGEKLYELKILGNSVKGPLAAGRRGHMHALCACFSQRNSHLPTASIARIRMQTVALGANMFDGKQKLEQKLS
jgi:hypothetical protein